VLLRIDPVNHGGSVQLEDVDDLSTLSIVARSESRDATPWTFHQSRLGVMTHDGTALVDPEALRLLGDGRGGADWDRRFDLMLVAARERGWTAPDGRLFVHTEWDASNGPGQDEPVPPDLLRQVLGRFPTGVVVAAASGPNGPVGLACQSFVSLSLDPPLVSLSPARTSRSWPQIAEAGVFCVSMLTEEQVDVCSRFSASGGDKFAGLSWHPRPVTGSPIVDGCLAWVDCRIELVHPAGDHELVVGRVVDLDVREGRPLIFFASQFAQLAELAQQEPA
jgi:3-hydroxy-9,10-secoandrosta-1,3,5(10)-triene-9,17-dione monooxygenase reductase component